MLDILQEIKSKMAYRPQNARNPVVWEGGIKLQGNLL